MKVDANEPDDVLRGIASDHVEPDNEALPTRLRGVGPTIEGTSDAVRYSVKPQGEPQASKTKYYIVDEADGQTYYAGKVLKWGKRRGLSRSSTLLIYDRFEAEHQIGQWAHFMWPSVMAESAGRYITINAWDRAHFTWGFYQLAAHTADDNLILLMRELLKLPLASRYFPDLALDRGKVSLVTSKGTRSLEQAVDVPVGSWTEKQIPDFMAYLNPTSTRVENGEVITAAKFAAWALEDPLMREATVRVSVEIMKRKIKSRVKRLGLMGREPELAIWVSDIYHQGRGRTSQIEAALAKPTLTRQLDALSKIDRTGNHDNRRKTVSTYVEKLLDEKRFEGVKFGEGLLSL